LHPFFVRPFCSRGRLAAFYILRTPCGLPVIEHLWALCQIFLVFPPVRPGRSGQVAYLPETHFSAVRSYSNLTVLRSFSIVPWAPGLFSVIRLVLLFFYHTPVLPRFVQKDVRRNASFASFVSFPFTNTCGINFFPPGRRSHVQPGFVLALLRRPTSFFCGLYPDFFLRQAASTTSPSLSQVTPFRGRSRV